MKTLISIFNFISSTLKGLFVIVGGKIFIDALLSGTVLFVLYPVIHHLFPLAAVNGIIPYYLKWVDSVCIVWIISLLFKSNTTIINQSPSVLDNLKNLHIKKINSEKDIKELEELFKKELDDKN